MAGEVTIGYDGIEEKIDIEDANAEFLTDLFGLSFDVKILMESDSGKKTSLKKLKPNLTYLIHKPKVESEGKATPSQETLESWMWKNQEMIQNALVTSKAVYHGDSEFLSTNLEDHNIMTVLRSQHGELHFLLAEEADSNRIYLAFRGTEDMKDVTEDLRIYQKASTSGRARGKFHAGFLRRAELFPLQKILADERFYRKHLIVCGHSLGGAISSIVATDILVEKKKRVDQQFLQDVTNITFGSPLFGDSNVRKFCDENQFSSKFYHFVADEDPVPSLLSFAQSISAVKNQVSVQIQNLMSALNTVGGKQFYEEKKQHLINKKTEYTKFLAAVGPFVSSGIDLAGVFIPEARLFGEAVKFITSLDHGNVEEAKRVYQPIGNYFFVNSDKENSQSYVYTKFEDVINKLDILKDVKVQSCIDCHKIDNYISIAEENGAFYKSMYPVHYEDFGLDGIVDFNPREVTMLEHYRPIINSAELVAVSNTETGCSNISLRLVIIGKHLSHICLPDCSFEFGFPFGQPEKVEKKEIQLGTKIEKLIIEQPMESYPDLAISEYGACITIATVFGSSDEYILKKSSIRNIVIQTVSQISKHESIALVIKKSVQRGMAMAQLRSNNHGVKNNSLEEPIVKEVMELSKTTLSSGDEGQMMSIFTESKNIQFILSNQEEYDKVSMLCSKIESFMRSPLNIEAEKTLLKKVYIGALAVLGGGAFAYMAGPGLLVIGAIQALNSGGVAAAAVTGFTGSGYVANRFFTEAITDQNYVKVLKWITMQLFNVFEKKYQVEEPNRVQEVSDLRDDDNTFSNEKALLLMFDKDLGIDNFKGSGIDKSTETSKSEVLRRIRCIQIVHNIRNILATQCFIGIVGIQDAGKTTLLNKIWGLKGKTGLFEHTDAPELHQISEKLHIVDFPGSNSLDYHAKTFSICGAMNNMIIVIVPFTGDVSNIISEEVAKVFGVMTGAESSRIILCVNKCGPYIAKLKEELKNEDDPIEFIKQRYITKLNDHFTSKNHIKITKEMLLFTDWELGDLEEGRKFGIQGVQDIKVLIKEYLVEYNIIPKDNKEELERAVKSCKTGL